MSRSIIVSYPASENSYVEDKLIKYNIVFSKKILKKNLFFLLLNEEEFLKLYKFDYKKIIKFERNVGLKYFLDFIVNNINLILVSIVIIISLFLSNFLVLKVNVHTSDVHIKNLVTYKLIDFGIHSFSLKKDSTRINKIKEYIKEKYNDDIEWIEITPHGYSYDVEVIKKKIKEPKKTDDKCNYIAKKSGNIKSIKVKRGVLLVQENNYVKAGDVLISGDVIYNEELKSQVCASGIITGEVWYKVDLSYPLTKRKEYPSNSKQLNFNINFFNNNIKIFNDKYSKKKPIKKIGNDLLGINFYKTFETKIKYVKIDKSEALNKAINMAKKKVLIKLPKSSKILSQNILKKYVKNDRIYVEVLLTTEEEIGVVENYY